jgi:hypothetical protein
MNFLTGDLWACPGAMHLELLYCPLQGLVDYALAPAGGRVISHSQLYPRPDDPAMTTWSQIGAAVVPGAASAVHPKANKVAYLHAFLAILHLQCCMHLPCVYSKRLHTMLAG